MNNEKHPTLDAKSHILYYRYLLVKELKKTVKLEDFSDFSLCWHCAITMHRQYVNSERNRALNNTQTNSMHRYLNRYSSLIKAYIEDGLCDDPEELLHMHLDAYVTHTNLAPHTDFNASAASIRNVQTGSKNA